MELSAEKNFENEKYKKYFQINDNTNEGTFQNSEKKNSFNINEIKAYLHENNRNNISNEYDHHLITDINNNFSSRKDLFQETSQNEDLVMNQSYNYNPNISNNTSNVQSQSQNILQISQNKNDIIEDSIPNNNYIFNSEKKLYNPRIFAEITTKKSTKTTASKKIENENSYNEEPYPDCNEADMCNTMDIDKDYKNIDKKEKNEIMEIKKKYQINDNQKKNSINSNQKDKNIMKNYLEYKNYEKAIVDNEDELLEIEEDTFGKYVDNIINRSYRVYTNRQCPSCAVLLSKGKSCVKCPKYHHLIKSGKN